MSNDEPPSVRAIGTILTVPFGVDFPSAKAAKGAIIVKVTDVNT